MAKSVEHLKGIIHPPATPVTVEDMHTAVAAAIQADWRQAFGDVQQAAIEFRNALLDRPWPDAARVVALLGAHVEPAWTASSRTSGLPTIILAGRSR